MTGRFFRIEYCCLSPYAALEIEPYAPGEVYAVEVAYLFKRALVLDAHYVRRRA